ncbi:hypothetical protein HY498_05115 [Candidatus Woesearchaeota archaeon]|nr:hypothetical protein [Candidatus Woesearchaeota archaeon]
MEETIRVFEVRKEVLRKDVTTERMIFELKEYENIGEKEWVYHAPNAQDHTEQQVEEILKKLKELNSTADNKG